MRTVTRNPIGVAAALVLSGGVVLAPLALAAPALADSGSASPAAAVVCPPVPIWVEDGQHLYQFAPDGTLISSVATSGRGDIAWSADGTVLYAVSPTTLDTVDSATGAITHSVPLTGIPGGFPVALTALASGQLMGGGGHFIYTIDPATGVVTPLLTLASNLNVAGDFVHLTSGDTLVAAQDGALPVDPVTNTDPAVLLRLHADNSVTEVGTLPGITPFGATTSGGLIYVASGTGALVRIDGPVPSAQSAAPIPFTTIANSPGTGFLGATSTQEATCTVEDVAVPLIGSIAAAAGTATVVAAGFLTVVAVRRRRPIRVFR
jgi:hypothetical protein